MFLPVSVVSENISVKQPIWKSLASYLHEVVWNVWIGALAGVVTVYELLRGFLAPETLAPIPSAAYWTLGAILLLFAPFRAFLRERRRADRYEALCRQVFEETFVFLNYGRESRRVPKAVVDEGMALLESIAKEVQAGEFSRAGMAVPLFHEMQNLMLDFYGSGVGSQDFRRRLRSIVDRVLAAGVSDRTVSAEMRSEAFEVYKARWVGKKFR